MVLYVAIMSKYKPFYTAFLVVPLLFVFSGVLISQNFSDEAIFCWIDKKPVQTWQFIAIKDKLAGETFEEKKQHFIDFKMKAIYAETLQKDTLGYFKFHMRTYKNMLAKKMLTDSLTENRLLREAYQRSFYDIQIDHIFVRSSYFDMPEDTLQAYQKISEAYDALLRGMPFSAVVKKYSEDTLSQKTYFTAFQLMYEFEVNAYQTPAGAYSKLFRTPVGYHIIFVKDKRPAIGSYLSAHIYLEKQDETAAQKIWEVYRELEKGVSFDTLAARYSQDRLTKDRGGRLPRLGVGQVFPDFENHILMTKEGGYSKPFQTSLGWHIIKLLSRSRPQDKSYIESELDLKDKLKDLPDRLYVLEKAIYRKLVNEISVQKKEKNLDVLRRYFSSGLTNVSDIPKSIFDLEILQIQDELYRVSDFVDFWDKEIDGLLKQGRKIRIESMVDRYNLKKVLEYCRDHVFDIYKKLQRDLHIFRDELLVTEVSNQEVWEPMQHSYEKDNLSQPKSAAVRERDLETKWLKRLQARFKVVFNEEVLLYLGGNF